MAEDGRAPSQPLLGLTAGEVRRAVDGWHAVLRIGSADRRIRSKDTPVLGAPYTAELPFATISTRVRMQAAGCGTQ
jgi:hypothetical protein